MASEPGLGRAELDRLVANFDHHTVAYRDHSVEILRHMQQTCPFAHSPSYGGFWIATKAETVLEIAKQADLFSSSPSDVIPAQEPIPMIPLNSDPPELYDYRAILNPLFAPKRMEAEAAEIRATAERLMDAIVANGGGDVVMDLAQPLTGITTLRLLGIDTADWPDYVHPLHDLVYSGRPLEERMATMAVMVEQMRDEIRRQKADPMQGGIIDYLHNVDMAGRKLTLDEIDSIVLIMLGGGLDTAQALVGMVAVYLGRNPDRRQELIDEPELMESAVEEFLRVFPPTQGNGRRAVRDATIAGQPIKAEELIFMSYAAANRDPEEFPDPDRVDFRRANNRHFSFGVGPHRCLGSHLARQEVIACLETLLSRAPNYRLVPGGVVKSTDIGTISGFDKVEIAL